MLLKELRQFAPIIRFHIDALPIEPLIEERRREEIPEKVKLSGWAFHPFHVTVLKLMYRPQGGPPTEVVRFGAHKLRSDVHDFYSRIRSSRFSGFELFLPTTLVQGLRGGALSLVAHAGIQKKEIWRSQRVPGSLVLSDEDALVALKQQFPVSGAFDFRFAEQRLSSLGVLIDWSGDEHSLRLLTKRVQVVFERSQFDWSAVRYLGILAPDKYDSSLVPPSFGENVTVEFVRRCSYPTWKDFFRKHPYLEGIFRAHPRYQFELISPRVLANELALNPAVGLVSPTTGEKSGRVLNELGKEIRYAKERGPVWLAKRSFLFSLPGELQTSPLPSPLPQYAQLQDIQVLPVTGSGAGAGSKGEHESSLSDLIVCSVESLSRASEKGEPSPAVALARALQGEGRRPAFCVTETRSSALSIEAFPIFTLQEIASARRCDESLQHLFALDLEGVALAFALRYLLKASVCRVVVEEQERLIEAERPELLQALSWARAALCPSVPLEKILSQTSDCLLTLSSNEIDSDAAEFQQECSEEQGLSIIVPVYNALGETERCLSSLSNEFSEEVQIIVVNDGSEEGVSERLRLLAEENKRFILVEHERNLGFIEACYSGLKRADSTNDIILVNSDVVVSKGIAKAVREAICSKPQTALFSPLSTGSHQLYLELRPEDSINSAAERLWGFRATYPTVVTPEGQFLLIRRWALKRFGFFDRVYERGFCEETDLAFRMFLHGAGIACIDNALVAHEQSASFGKKAREALYQKNKALFEKRWGSLFEILHSHFVSQNPLSSVRQFYERSSQKFSFEEAPFDYRALFEQKESPQEQTVGRTIPLFQGGETVFVLPNVVPGGGSLSVLQHATQMTALGKRVLVVSFGRVEEAAMQETLCPVIRLSFADFERLNWSDQVVIATFWTTAYALRKVHSHHPGIVPFYYVQDFEPWFYDVSSPDRNAALQSYSFGFPMVAKTDFLCRTVAQEVVGQQVEKISPGVLRGIFFPGTQEQYFGRPRIAALYRPSTPRRRGDLLLDVLSEILRRLPETQVMLYGGGSEELAPEFLNQVTLSGQISQREVANLYRSADITFDLSDWQGFGRMGIEAMSCGCVPILTRSGGVEEYATEENSLLLEVGSSPMLIAQKAVELLVSRQLRMEKREAGLLTSAQFSEQRASQDWCSLISDYRSRRASVEAQPAKVA